MSSRYEFRIICPDRKKNIHFGTNYTSWAEIYNAAAAVDGEEPDQFNEGGFLIGKTETSVPYKEAIETMINEAFLNDRLAKILRSEEIDSDCKEE